METEKARGRERPYSIGSLETIKQTAHTPCFHPAVSHFPIRSAPSIDHL